MANMSYCRFENTLGDLQDCLDSLRDRDELSKSEKRARDEMIDVCHDFILEYEAIIEEEDDEDDEEEEDAQ